MYEEVVEAARDLVMMMSPGVFLFVIEPTHPSARAHTQTHSAQSGGDDAESSVVASKRTEHQ